MRHLDLFSGIGGFALSATWTWKEEYETVAFVEREKFCQEVIAKHWPEVPIINDVRDCLGKDFGKIDLITGGFPCQPFSVAGKQKGKEDDRYLWPTMLEIIAQQRPTWVLGENVPGIIGMALDKVLADLESEGYATRTFIIPACAVNAPHRRDRVWIVAHSSSERTRGESGTIGNKERGGIATTSDNNQKGQEKSIESERICKPKGEGDIQSQIITANTKSSEPREQAERERRKDTERGGSYRGRFAKAGGEGGDFFQQFPTQPPVCRRDDGLPDRMGKLKALGNSIVPQVAAHLMQLMKQYNT